MTITRRQMTLDEFLRLGEEKPALEFFDGVVTQKVSPKGQHSTLQLAFAKRLDSFGEARKLARAFTELRSTFSGISTVPDIAVYRWERIPVDDQGEVVNDFREPPDISIEIVSPEQGVNALIRRCLWYVANGVAVALLVDPDDRSVIIFRPDQALKALHGPDPIDLTDVLPGFDLTVQELFASLRMR